MPSRIPARTKRGAMTAASLVLLALAAAGFGVAVHSQPLAAEPGPGIHPPVVSTATVEWTDGYTVTRSFVGRVEARQESDLGFELGGTVATLLVDEGARVDAGGVVALLDRDRLEARREELRAMRDEARARLELAQLTLRRITEALALNATSQQEHDNADKTASAAAAALQRAEAAIASLDVDIEKTVLRSPFSAVVAARYVDAGRVVDAGTPVLLLLERASPEARIGVAASSVSSISEGQAVEVMVGGKAYAGIVRSILPTRDRGGRTVDVIVALDAELDGLRSGDLARLRVSRRIATDGFWVPIQALTEGVRGLWSLFALERVHGGQHHRVLQASVELIHVEADRAFVRGTVPTGTHFVAAGLHRVAPGMTVRSEAPTPTGGPWEARP